ncbi:histidine phosphatase superfamily [Microdochium bolleyi]|uniref:Histidine phosphatase superfamily n=1 Tax=Microdochium bolleyi TaxID=196109 RepID=A0A136JGQ7_9PEZI|nr:histidine phosphatase superfamily [Microdochium bolleyi]
MHPTVIPAVAALVLSSGVAAQSSSETIWSSFVYVLYGDRTPSRPDSEPALTSLGAQQLFSQGSLFKARYLPGSASNDSSDSSASHPIAGIDSNALFTSQLSISSSADDWVFGSALAFTQGLYPPTTAVLAGGNGPANSSYLANGSMVVSPLNGYQYPSIRTLSVLDPSSIWIQGQASCANYVAVQAQLDYTNNLMYNETLVMYKSIFDTAFPGSFPASMVNYNYAFDLWQYAAYQYTHNATVRALLSGSELALLRQLANVQQFDINGNLTSSQGQPGSKVHAVAGRTLAAAIVSQLSSNIGSGGSSNKLSLSFGSYESFLGLFALLGLAGTQPDRIFSSIPDAGAAMVFELFTPGKVDNGPLSPDADLRVRFLYRNGTADGVPLLEYPLFGRALSDPEMPFANFTSAVSNFAIKDLSEWCNVCSAVTLYCTGIKSIGDNAGGNSSSIFAGGYGGALSPTAAGLLGAGCSIGVLLLAGAAAAVFGGYRVRRQGSQKAAFGDSGGFKGDGKPQGDQDVTLAKNGTAHARSGSWELGKGTGAKTSASRVDEAISPGGAGERSEVFGASFVHRGRDGDADSVMGAQPVRPAEAV